MEPTSTMVGQSLEETDERPQQRGHEAPSRVVKERPRETLPPGFQNRLEGAGIKMRAKSVLKEI